MQCDKLEQNAELLSCGLLRTLQITLKVAFEENHYKELIKIKRRSEHIFRMFIFWSPVYVLVSV